MSQCQDLSCNPVGDQGAKVRLMCGYFLQEGRGGGSGKGTGRLFAVEALADAAVAALTSGESVRFEA